ncbi:MULTISPECIES: pyridoxamine 5'-phosphate oxidase family protein [unclassified Cupriavidus]|uniref:pyridoxamine 5'-phosphate oxidase family protein n=1 Tax=unclassified Cupriavidus TaxID=2640874 RepID=UPI001C00516B|nr:MULTISPECIES: pyridoxamine 5'-phosphate oxidase family protein [unclassified Cupriavidus]MCA3186049.1 pyridoxamine 5'-phosphate oxidase family protein [Cupriavidus sp.]MCA3192741.1 pyridoxamine 5'-phosphate oxidase family protein [Cupriavidus sp.]MCA3194942.1 pyridoxamine 5'-phosphate oxidase family protein [Cupriavidus sp.]MCA3200580.1 pyridoxamine 5'-phosphate oxidase family protein [Cupriavidus sp.]MCA3205671.1 pyridoxamine 5'-phosphate oxidase family protein [Cupriavidus sp.]
MPSHDIATLAELEALYAEPGAASLAKEVDYLHPHYRAFVEASPFCLLSTMNDKGGDCSPRGDAPGFVQVLDDRTLLLPDRRGNNRIDSLRNILADPRVGLLFLVPGVNETLRVSGTATVSTDPELIARCMMQDKAPTTVLVIRIESVFFQCARALLRSRLWLADAQIPREALPSTGSMLADLSQNAIDGVAYDRELPERVRTTLY